MDTRQPQSWIAVLKDLDHAPTRDDKQTLNGFHLMDDISTSQISSEIAKAGEILNRQIADLHNQFVKVFSLHSEASTMYFDVFEMLKPYLADAIDQSISLPADITLFFNLVKKELQNQNLLIGKNFLKLPASHQTLLMSLIDLYHEFSLQKYYLRNLLISPRTTKWLSESINPLIKQHQALREEVHKIERSFIGPDKNNKLVALQEQFEKDKMGLEKGDHLVFQTIETAFAERKQNLINELETEQRQIQDQLQNLAKSLATGKPKREDLITIETLPLIIQSKINAIKSKDIQSYLAQTNLSLLLKAEEIAKDVRYDLQNIKKCCSAMINIIAIIKAERIPSIISQLSKTTDEGIKQSYERLKQSLPSLKQAAVEVQTSLMNWNKDNLSYMNYYWYFKETGSHSANEILEKLITHAPETYPFSVVDLEHFIQDDSLRFKEIQNAKMNCEKLILQNENADRILSAQIKDNRKNAKDSLNEFLYKLPSLHQIIKKRYESVHKRTVDEMIEIKKQYSEKFQQRLNQASELAKKSASHKISDIKGILFLSKPSVPPMPDNMGDDRQFSRKTGKPHK